MTPDDADRVLAFVRIGRAPAALVAGQAADEAAQQQRAARITKHWRNEVAALTAAPGIAGRLSDVVVDIVGATAQGLLVLSLCELAGVTDEGKRTRLVAAHVLDETLPGDWSADHEVALDPEDDDDPVWRRALGKAPGAVVGALKAMWAVRRLTGQRAEGRFWQRALSSVPVVGVAGRVLGERHAMEELSQAVCAELELAQPEVEREP